MNTKDNFMLVKNQRITSNQRLSAKAKRRLEKAKADNTLKAYACDWSDFADWCQYHGERDLPTTPETIVNYINDLADDAKANTVARRITAISENHIAAGYGKTILPRTAWYAQPWQPSAGRKARFNGASPRFSWKPCTCWLTALMKKI